MKKLILITLAASVIFAACSPNPNNPIPANSSAQNHWIPNWTNDTLFGYLSNDRGWIPDTADTIYTIVRGDTSLIEYKGVEYYVWTDNTINNGFENNQPSYFSYIGQHPMDTINYLTKCIASPSKYWDDSYNNWVYQKMGMVVDLKPPFPQNIIGGLYQNKL